MDAVGTTVVLRWLPQRRQLLPLLAIGLQLSPRPSGLVERSFPLLEVVAIGRLTLAVEVVPYAIPIF